MTRKYMSKQVEEHSMIRTAALKYQPESGLDRTKVDSRNNENK